jgi:hypothetical protein
MFVSGFPDFFVIGSFQHLPCIAVHLHATSDPKRHVLGNLHHTGVLRSFSESCTVSE